MPIDAAVQEKAFAAERRVALVRWAVIAFNSVMYVAWVQPEGHIPWLAWTIIVVAWSYAAFVIFARPYERFPVMTSVYFTTVSDASLIALWIAGTGGWESPFYVLWYVSIAAIAFRFTLAETLVTTAAYGVVYAGTLAVLGEVLVDPATLGVRAGYIFLVGWMAGLIGQETYQQTRAKLEMKELAEASGSMTEDLSVPAVARRTVEAGLRIVSADKGALFRLDDGQLSCLHAHGLSPGYVDTVEASYEDLPGAKLLEGGGFVHVEDAADQELLGDQVEALQEEGIRCFLVVPLTVYGEPVGALALYRDHRTPFSKDEIEMARSLASHAATALENARLVTEVRSSEERWRSLVEHAPNIVSMVDRDGHIQFVNRVPENVSKEGALGSSLYDWVPAAYHDRVRQALDAVFERGESVSYEVPGPGQGEDRAWYANRVGPLRVGGEVEAALIISLDITERRQMEEEIRRSNADLEQFAYVASHDLQEPLRMVASYVQLLERRYRDQLDEEANEYIDYAVEGSQRMQALIKDLLTYARVDRSPEPFEPVDLQGLIEEVTTDLGTTVEESGAEINWGQLPTVLAVRSQIKQVLQNLVANALKFRTTEPPRVRIDAEQDGEEWVITVEDNGIGIDPDYADKVFQLFQRLNHRSQYPGTGIGLAICRKVVERHGGRIWVESKGTWDPPRQNEGPEPSGSLFRFTLPSQEVHRAPPRPKALGQNRPVVDLADEPGAAP